MIVRCEYCDIEIEAKTRKKRFCSTKCYKASRYIKRTLICPFCKIEFIPSGGHQTYCSGVCRENDRKQNYIPRTIPQRNCEICSELYTPKVGNQKFCSQECFNIHREKYCEELDEKRKIVRQCRYCGNDFRRIDEGSGFCTRSCAAKWNIEHGLFEVWRTRKNDLKPRRIQPCDECGTALESLETYRPGKLRFCNRICKGKYHSKHFSGENSPTFGRKLPPDVQEKATQKQIETLNKNHPGLNLKNAYELSQHRIKSKPQVLIYEFLCKAFPELEFEIEKRVSFREKELYADIVSFKTKLIIEFNGDYWHCNPNTYEPTFFHEVKNCTAQEIWAGDLKRLNIIENEGYKTILLWESDLKKENWKELLVEKVKNATKN